MDIMNRSFMESLQNIADGDFSVETYRYGTFLIADPDPIGFPLEILVSFENSEVILREKDQYHEIDEFNRMLDDFTEWPISLRDFQFLTEVDPEAIFKIVEILKCADDSEDSEDFVHQIVLVLKAESSNTLDNVFERYTEESDELDEDKSWKEAYYFEEYGVEC